MRIHVNSVNVVFVFWNKKVIMDFHENYSDLGNNAEFITP